MISINLFVVAKRCLPLRIHGELGKFDKTSLPEKEDLYSHLNMKGITDADYTHGIRVYKDFEIENISEYHNLYVQSETLLLADAFENFQNMCLGIYEWTQPCSFSFSTRVCKANSLKKDQSKLRSINWFWCY